MPRRLSLVSATILLIGSSSCIEAVAGEFPATVTAGSYELTLNGWGARKKSFLQMYLGALYLPQKSGNAGNIISANSPMAIRIEITSGFVSQQKMVAALSEGFDNSTNGHLEPIRRAVDQFRLCFADEITKGDVFDIVYLPAHGVSVTKNGRLKGVIKGIAFKQALFGIWLSDRPADKGLKRAMLGI